MRTVLSIGLLCVLIVSAYSQDLHENGILVVESTFDDFDPGPLNAGGLTVIGVFDDIEGNDTPVIEMEAPGGTENTWNELLSINFDTPENPEEVIWRFQYRIRVTDAPYQAQVRLQINQEPWNGFNDEKVIGEGHEEKWIFYDFLEGPFADFDFEVLNFSLRFGTQQYQLFWMDDIRVYQSNALFISTFEGNADKRFAIPYNTDLEFVDEDNAPEGLGIVKASVSSPGSSIGDAGISLSRYVNGTRYDGAMRMVLDVRADSPVELRGGIADSNTLNDQLVYAQDRITVEGTGEWTTVSFLIPPIPFEATRLFPFLQFGGQGNVEFDYDHMTLLKTDEEVTVNEVPDTTEPPDVPVSVQDWSIY